MSWSLKTRFADETGKFSVVFEAGYSGDVCVEAKNIAECYSRMKNMEERNFWKKISLSKI